MKITQARMAQIANVTTRTIINWEKEKPELIRIIKQGIKADNNYKEFFKLFEPYNFLDLEIFYKDFYYKFLNYVRKNITLNKNSLAAVNADMGNLAITYLIEKTQNELFDENLYVNSDDMRKFELDSHKRPLFNVNQELSIYIQKNTLDGFGTLVNDALYKDDKYFEISLAISIDYLVYMFKETSSFEDKNKLSRKIFYDYLNINPRNSFEDLDKEKIYKKYLNFKKDFFIENIDTLSEEWEVYCNNDFYIPGITETVNKHYQKK